MPKKYENRRSLLHCLGGGARLFDRIKPSPKKSKSKRPNTDTKGTDKSTQGKN